MKQKRREDNSNKGEISTGLQTLGPNDEIMTRSNPSQKYCD
jgi:hypothetical protein